MPTGYSFGEILPALWNGQAFAREGWNGKNMKIELQFPDNGSKMTRPYIYMTTVDGDLVPWVASQTDLLAADWQEVEDNTTISTHK